MTPMSSVKLAEMIERMSSDAKIQFTVRLCRWAFSEVAAAQWYHGELQDRVEWLFCAFEEQRAELSETYLQLHEDVFHVPVLTLSHRKLIRDIIDFVDGREFWTFDVNIRHLATSLSVTGIRSEPEAMHVIQCIVDEFSA